MGRTSKRVDTAGGAGLSTDNPFAALSTEGLPAASKPLPPQEPVAPKPPKKAPWHGARLEIRRLKAGKGGKVVTEISGFPAVARRPLEDWSRELKQRLGVGGRVAEGVFEIQGDQRDVVMAYFKEAGFRPVFAGG
ncbi:MAG: translation initiation factor [Opitutales bacterium]|nr:translation initiation factor [Opitutales bacterium]